MQTITFFQIDLNTFNVQKQYYLNCSIDLVWRNVVYQANANIKATAFY